MIYRTNRAAWTNAKREGWKWLIVASVCGACGLFRAARPETMPDGSLRVSCTSPLSECLATLDDTVCRDGYDVIRAQEKRERRGPEPLPQQTISSEAFVRCRTPEALFSFSKSDRNSGPLPASDAAAPEDVTAPQGSAAAATSAAATTPDAASE